MAQTIRWAHGAIAFSRTEPTGEVLGCGGEGGMCGAMAAAAIAEMAGGTAQQVEDAALLCTSRGGACHTPTAARLMAGYRRWAAGTPPEERPPGNLI